MVTDERFSLRVEQRPFDRHAADRVGPVEDDDTQLVCGGRFENESQRRNVRVEAAADVLDVVDERVNPLKLLSRGPLGLAVKTVNGEPGFRVFTVRYRLVHLAADAVLRAEQGYQRNAGCLVEQVNRA